MRDQHASFDWDDKDDYELEKYRHNNIYVDNVRDELMDVIYHIRRDLKNKRINVYVNNYLQIIINIQLNCVETLFSVSHVFEEIHEMAKKYLSDFNVANFEISMERGNPTIYCSYERI